MIYVHVPLCQRFCTYCDFYSEIHSEQKAALWGEAVVAEIRRRSHEIDDSVKTLYFGGGTPSVLPLSILTRILVTLDECGHGGPYTEFTLEANPDDVVARGVGYVRSLLALGMNRLSLGIQSFDDGMLRWMNRRHDAEGAREAVRIAREAGVRNLSIDLIFGISHLEESVWDATLEEAVALRPEHISCYQLSVEGESALARMVAEGKYKEADEEQCRQQYDRLCERLGAAGYHHYEISNFALPGYEAVHNSGYWQRAPYVGFGPSAHSFNGRNRSWNESVLTGYTSTEEILSEEDTLVETVMLSLRRDSGIDAETLHGICNEKAIGKLVAEGALLRQGERYRIPEDHFFVSDEIIRELI